VFVYLCELCVVFDALACNFFLGPGKVLFFIAKLMNDENVTRAASINLNY
jgi:hypothetical protein